MSALIGPVDPDLYYIPKAKPVLKWVGSKRELAPVILQEIDRLQLGTTISVYYEPFAGGLAVFFALRSQFRIQRAVLSDTNAELINFYGQIKNEPEAFIRALRDLKKQGAGEKHYYEVRASKPSGGAARAARFKYINANGYNGLWRVNQKNICNVPWGRHKKPPEILDEEAIWAAHHALSIAEIRCEGYEQALDRLTQLPGFCYLDPPYWPTCPTANFTSYTSANFGAIDQAVLARRFRELTSDGRNALLSNSDVPETRKLYRDFKKKKVSARRAVNSVGTGRGAVSELLVESTFRK